MEVGGELRVGRLGGLKTWEMRGGGVWRWRSGRGRGLGSGVRLEEMGRVGELGGVEG